MVSDYYFDAERARRATEFFPRFLRFTEGEWAGRPFELQAWQARGIGEIFGWRRHSDDTRRYRRFRWWLPRKNGKTELLAGIAHLLTIGDGEPGAQVYSHALDKRQASIVFEKATAMLRYSPQLSGLYEATKTSLFCPKLQSAFRPLSGEPKGKHGLSPHGALGDEAHEWRTRELHTFLVQGMGARRQPVDGTISTAGQRNTTGHELFEESVKIRDGIIPDDETHVMIYAADPDDDWADEKVWAKANPNLGVSLKLDFLRSEFLRAKENPRVENDFRRYHLNQWVGQETRWLPMDAWRKCGSESADDWVQFEDKLAGRPCFGGLDLGSTSDITALVWFFPARDAAEQSLVLCRFWVPFDTIEPRVRRDLIPYDRWARTSALLTTPGNVTDYAAIRQRINEDAKRFNIQKLAIDRWEATQLAVELQQDGFSVAMFGQGFASMGAPSKELERQVIGGFIDHGNHPVLTWMAANAAVETNAAGGIKPAKDRAADKIDGIVALVMAIGLAPHAAPLSFWETASR